MAKVSFLKSDSWEANISEMLEAVHSDETLAITIIVHAKDRCFRASFSRHEKNTLSLEMVIGRLRIFENDLIEEYDKEI